MHLVGRIIVISIEKADNFSLTSVKASIEGGSLPPVLFKHRDNLVSVPGNDLPGIIGGAVIYYNDLTMSIGLVLIEAQAAGLNCVISDVIPEEADVVRPLVRRLSLSQSPVSWADALLAVREAEDGISQPEALDILENSPFNIDLGVKELEDFYLED